MRYALVCLLLLCGCQLSKPEQPKKERVLRTCLGSIPTSLDPRKEANMASQSVVRMLLTGLVRLDAHLIPQFELAESYEVSPDFKTYTFKLKKCQWSDGSPITAYDFEQSWKQGLSPAFSCANTNLLFFIKNGKKAFLDPTYVDQFGAIALDSQTLRIELEKPNPHFLNILINSVFSPVHQSMRTPSSGMSTMICSGPFFLKEHIPQNRIILQRNENYWNQSEVKLDEICYYISTDQSTALLLFEKGEIDVLGPPLCDVSIDAIPNLKKTGCLKFSQKAGTRWILLNTTRYPLNNRHIRLALAYAIDREGIQKNILHIDKTRPGLGLIPKILKKERWHPWFQDHDTEQAQALFAKGLQELGITAEEFPKLNLSFGIARSTQTVLLALQQMWKQTLGIDVILNGMDAPVAIHQLLAGNFDMDHIGWVAQYNDPSCLLEIFKYNAAPNYTGWENPDFIRHADEFLALSEDEKRWENAEAAEQIFFHDMPSIPLTDIVVPYLVQPHVKGLVSNLLLHVDFDRATVD